jgi:hypothetical protein
MKPNSLFMAPTGDTGGGLAMISRCHAKGIYISIPIFGRICCVLPIVADQLGGGKAILQACILET